MKTKWMKIFFYVLLAGIIIISGYTIQPAEPAAQESDQNLTITASFYPIYIALLNIVQDIPGVEVMNLTPPVTGCLHDYTLTPEDMKNLEKTDILVNNGAGMESFLDEVASRKPDLRMIDASKGITLLRDEEGDNPHVWVSISKAIIQVENIADQLAALDPKHADKYGENSAAYIAKLSELRDRMHRELDGIENRNIITFHESFPYFAEEFDLQIAGVIEREPGTEPSAKELAETIEKVRALDVKAIFVEPQYPAKTAEVIARETGANVYTLDPVVTGPENDDAYLRIMESNLKTLKEALS